jgi:3D (Asp-Asp-Asp) domain-containing protein
MRGHQYLTLALSLLVVGCTQNASRPKSTAGLSKEGTAGKIKKVRTTAYTGSEGNRYNAIGSRVQSTNMMSAAADWSRFPYGTIFRLLENNQTYVVDDYGAALVGTETIDLYMPSRHLMNRWGVRHVSIELVEPGSYAKSLQILRPRKRLPYVRRMVNDLEKKL